MSSIDMDVDVIRPIIAWIKRELVLTIIVEQPNTQRPPVPYIGLMVIAPPVKQGRDSIEEPAPGSGDPSNVGGQRRLTVSIRSYVDPKKQNFYQAQNLLIKLQDSLEDEARRVELTNAGLAVWNSNVILDTTTQLETGFEPRAQFDLELGIASNRDATTGEIDKVEAEGTYNNDFTSDIVVPVPIP